MSHCVTSADARRAARRQVKADADRAYLAALSKPHLATPAARIRDALAEFARLYPRPPTDRRPAAEDEARLYRELRARWGAAEPRPPSPLRPPDALMQQMDFLMGSGRFDPYGGR